MTPERWQQIEELYHGALEREPDQRTAYLAEVCGGDESLRKEVDSLLARDASSPDIVLNHPVAGRLAPGMRLGPYEIEAQLGAGGMGEVWKARDTRLDRIVALKVSKTEFNQRFEREARAVAALNHPHIAALYDVGPNYFVMEYVDGKPLQQLIPRKGLNVAQVLNYAAQIADALAAAHAAGIVHRDLKPGNIMMTSDDRVKVVDFGLARVAAPRKQDPEDPTFTQTAEGTIAGTVSYMSPEQAQGKAVDARSDIFSFGAVLYEMLTGAKAFRGDSSMSTLADILNKNPRPVSELVGDVPREVETLLSRCLRKDPARRWQNMADVKVALLDLKEDSESGRLNAAVPSSLDKRRLPLWIRAGAVVVLLAVAAGWYWARSHPSGNVAFNPIPLTSYPGMQIQPSFSPDGNQVAFAWNGPQRDNFDIYVKVVGEGEPLRLTSDPRGELAPAWSPDGRSIAFARMLTGHRYALMLISPLGGAVRKLREFDLADGNAAAFAWTNDSKHLFLPAKEESGNRNGLFVLSVETGDLRQVTNADPQSAGDTTPALSPDGRMLAFTRGPNLSPADLYILDLADDLSPKGTPRLLVSGVASGAAWIANGKELIYSAGPFAAARLERVAVSGPPRPVRLGIADNALFFIATSRAPAAGTSRLAWMHRFTDANIYRVELPARTEKGAERTVNPQLWIASSFRDTFPQYSPDGKSIAFYSARSGGLQVWISQADGSGPRQLTTLDAPVTAAPRWSPDGKQIAFDSDKEGPYEVYVVSSEGGLPRRMTDPPAASFTPNWSPDGQWLYFTSNRGGTLNIWKMPAEGGPAQQVTLHGGAGATLSPDGKNLYYVKDTTSRDASLWRVALAGGDEVQMVPRIHRFSYAVTERGIYFAVPLPTSPGGTIEFLDPDTGRRSVLARTDKTLDLGVSVSPDGRYLLYSQIDYLGGNLMMVENFR